MFYMYALDVNRMNKIDRLSFAEGAVTYALFSRIKDFSPDRASAIKEVLTECTWGKELVDSWNEKKRFIPIWRAFGETGDHAALPLRSIFSRLSINEEVPKQDSHYKPEVWQEPVKFPQYEKPSIKEVRHYWMQISKSWMDWIAHCSNDVEVRFSSFIEWTERWLSSVPVNQQNDVVSLSDHFKLMGAVAVACGSGTSFQIVLGDVSGIQSYLFDISHIGVGGVAKRLRARSFILGLLSDAAAHKLLLKHEMPIINLILSAGGIFYAIIPDSGSITSWKKDINTFLYHQYHGAITLHSAVKKVTLEELEQLSNYDIVSELHEGIQVSKGQPFGDVLQENGKWCEQSFVHELDTSNEPCKSCRRYSRADNDLDLCEWCRLDEQVGRVLPHTHYLIFNRRHGLIHLFDDVYVDLASTVSKDFVDQAYLVQGWNDADLNAFPLPVQRKWVANYVPTAPVGGCPHCLDQGEDEPVTEGEPLTFKCIAHQADGKKLLGYLKADVDHLGMLLSVGLKRDKAHDDVRTLAQLPSLSKMLERFFAGGINQWLKKHYPYLYTVFSGGDDLYLIGPWDDLLKAATDIQQYFQKYTGYNPDITMSAGISIVKATSPVSHVSKEVEKRLDQAKDKPNRLRAKKDPNAVGRNQVVLRGEAMEWSDVLRINEQAKLLSQWWQQRNISSSFLHYLLHLSKLYLQYRGGTMAAVKFVPLLSYYIDRNLDDIQPSRRNQDVIDWSKELLNINHDAIDWKWGYMKPIVELANLYRSEKGED